MTPPTPPAGSGITTVHTASGSVAIAASAEDELAGCTSAGLVRHFGATRLETAIAIARDFYSSPDTFALATGFKWPDAVVGGNVSHVYEAPILLTGDDELFPPLVSYIDEQSPTADGLVLGGPAVVPDPVEAQFEAALR